MLWTFSIFLEAVAIFPQLVMLQRTKEVETLTADYVGALGAYRFLYILNWIYRYYEGEMAYSHAFVWVCGVVQTGLYVDFFYYYLQRYVPPPLERSLIKESGEQSLDRQDCAPLLIPQPNNTAM